MSVPNPGSQAALDRGCRCPVYDNYRGDPELGRSRGFVVVVGCPLHDVSALATTHPPTEAR